MPAPIVRVIVGIIFKQQQILICRRLAHQTFAGLWEFPGGKIKNNESEYRALKREMREELAIEVSQAEPWACIWHSYQQYDVSLAVWKINQYHNTPCGNEGQQCCFKSPAELRAEDFPPANRVIIEVLRYFSSANS